MAEDNLTPELYSEKNILIGRVQNLNLGFFAPRWRRLLVL